VRSMHRNAHSSPFSSSQTTAQRPVRSIKPLKLAIARGAERAILCILTAQAIGLPIVSSAG
jgi:hypothetical protein